MSVIKTRNAHVVRPRSRREMLQICSAGFGYVALAGLLGEEAAASHRGSGQIGHMGHMGRMGPASRSEPSSLPRPHFPARAKRVIFLFMGGGPSSIDSFDPKPRLIRDDGGTLPFAHPVGIIDPHGKLMRSPWEFRQYGQSGLPVSSLFPEVGKCVDDLCVLRAVHTEGQAHGQAVLKLHTGDAQFVRPSVGSWVLYGLGTENQNLPGFISICPSGGQSLYGGAFLPAVYQGTSLGQKSVSMTKAEFAHSRSRVAVDTQREQIDLLQDLNRHYLNRARIGSELEGVIESYELAFRMQSHAPDLMDMSRESKATLELYGIGQQPTDNFGRQCLLARRALERGVRYVQISGSDGWDQHAKLKEGHEKNAREVDRPIAGLLKDLKTRGLLDDTLVWWGGEFGRTPTAQGKDGRDHNPHGFTMWLAGGGIKGGLAYGATDDFGYHAVENKVHMHDLHATILHLMGLDHTRLTYRYAGRDFRLTDVYGNVVTDILE